MTRSSGWNRDWSHAREELADADGPGIATRIGWVEQIREEVST